MFNIQLSCTNKFVEVSFTHRRITTRLVHRIELNYSDLKKYDSIMASNYLSRLYSERKEKICITDLTNHISDYMKNNYDYEKNILNAY